MKAVRLYGREDLRIDDVAEPTVGAGEIMLKNAYVGLCGSDVHMYFAP